MTLQKAPRTAVLKLVPKLGFWRCALHLRHQLKLRTGVYGFLCRTNQWPNSLPTHEWAILDAKSPFVRPDETVIRRVVGQSIQEQAILAGRRILENEFPYFSYHWKKRPEDWRSDPSSGRSTPLIHWRHFYRRRILDCDPKWLWEPSRFDWVYDLIRAAVISGDNAFEECFWQLLDSWRKHNPPNQGANWMCGQECSLRLIALVWAGGMLAHSATSTTERKTTLWQTVAALAQRVEATSDYALSQNNNHGLSESLALYLSAVCMPDHPRAWVWRRRGHRLFCMQIPEQFAPDGSYILNSTNYTREALRLAFIFLYVSKKSGEQIPALVTERVAAGATFLSKIINRATGRVPNYGHNDGANIFRLSGCDYLDFRPVLQTVWYLIHGSRLFPSGPHDEELAWHFGTEACNAPIATIEQPTTFEALNGGYYGIRQPKSFLMVRCHSHHARPSHADMLHVDLWKNHENILLDGGTFQYACDNGIGEHLKSTSAHNTATVDGLNQMPSVSPFLWADWTKSRSFGFTSTPLDDNICIAWSGEHYGYLANAGFVHRRSIYSHLDAWVIVDDLLPVAPPSISHEVEIRWHLSPTHDWRKGGATLASRQLQLDLSIYSLQKYSLKFFQGPRHAPLTLRSLYYGHVENTDVAALRMELRGSSRLVTVIDKNQHSLRSSSLALGSLHIPLAPPLSAKTSTVKAPFAPNDKAQGQRHPSSPWQSNDEYATADLLTLL